MNSLRRSLVIVLTMLPLVIGVTLPLVTQGASAQPALHALLVTAGAAAAQSESAGMRQFLQKCVTCHGGDANVPNAPDVATLRRMPPERIYESMTTGTMQAMAQGLDDGEKRLVAEYLAGRTLDTADVGAAENMPNVCSSHPPIRRVDGPAWNGWGVDLANTRFQPGDAARLSAGQVSRLELKWAFGFHGATALYGQTVVDGRVFVASNAGYVYALDAQTGCVHWSFRAESGVRSGVVIGPVKQGAGHAAFFGDIHGNVYAVDARTGDRLWTVPIDPHPLSRITATPKLYQGRLYVSVASLEEDASGSPNSECCTFRGMVAALDAETGKQLWKTYTISEEPKPVGKNSLGKTLWGPAGAGVWVSPAIDPQRNAVYVATGNAFSEPVTKTSDAVMALDMDSGRVLWSMQAHPRDVWHLGCQQTVPGRAPEEQGPPTPKGYPPENCPEETGPDWDFSSAPILTKLPSGRSVLIAAQKHGLVWALDPDRQGAVIWKQDVAREIAGGRGETLFGGALSDETIYFGLVSSAHIALDLSTGVEKWFSPIEPPEAMAKKRGIVAAVSLIPGVLFSGGRDGMLRAVSSTNGQLLWEFNTAQEFETVNRVPAEGGSIGAGGPTIAQGMVFVGSGYVGFQGGVPGNVLLAFAPRVRLDTIAEGDR